MNSPCAPHSARAACASRGSSSLRRTYCSPRAAPHSAGALDLGHARDARDGASAQCRAPTTSVSTGAWRRGERDHARRGHRVWSRGDDASELGAVSPARCAHFAHARWRTARALGRRTLVAAEVALSLMLVIGASLLTLSFVRLQRVEPGFNLSNALTANVALPPPARSTAARRAGLGAILPAAAGSSRAQSGCVGGRRGERRSPTSSVEGGGTATVGGAAGAGSNHAQYLVIEGDFFRAMGIKLVPAAPSVPAISRRPRP